MLFHIDVCDLLCGLRKPTELCCESVGYMQVVYGCILAEIHNNTPDMFTGTLDTPSVVSEMPPSTFNTSP